MGGKRNSCIYPCHDSHQVRDGDCHDNHVMVMIKVMTLTSFVMVIVMTIMEMVIVMTMVMVIVMILIRSMMMMIAIMIFLSLVLWLKKAGSLGSGVFPPLRCTSQLSIINIIPAFLFLPKS